MEAAQAAEKALECLVEIISAENVRYELKLEAAKVILNRPRHFIEDPNIAER